MILFLCSTCDVARADSGAIASWEAEYKVQVEYWYWDSESYHWEDFYVSTNYDAANFVFLVLDLARKMGTLNQAAPHVNWKFFAVDVRMIVVYKRVYEPKFVSDQTLLLDSKAWMAEAGR